MANEQHLRLLSSSVSQWNTYLDSQPDGFRADLTGADLTEAKLIDANLYGADLTRADLYGADLTGATYDSLTVWPERFDPDAAGALNKDSDGPDTSEVTGLEGPPVVGVLLRAARLETVEQKQLALQGSENIVGELQKIVDDQRLSPDPAASLQSEIDVLNGLRKNPAFDIRRFEMTLAKVAEIIDELDGLTKDTHTFLNLVQGLGVSNLGDAGNQISGIAEEVSTPPLEPDDPVTPNKPEEKSPFSKGIEKGIERLGEDLVAKYLPRTAMLVTSGTATVVFGTKYAGSASLVRAVIETLLAFLA